MVKSGFPQVIKSGQTRNVNRAGNNAKMVSYCEHHRANSKPVSINFLRGFVKNYNAQISSGLHDNDTLARLFIKRDTIYAAIKMFQAAYNAGDNSALQARMFCRLNGIVVLGDAAVTEKIDRNTWHTVASAGGRGEFDEMGEYRELRPVKPKIPNGEGHTAFDAKESARMYSKKVASIPNDAPNSPVKRDYVRNPHTAETPNGPRAVFSEFTAGRVKPPVRKDRAATAKLDSETGRMVVSGSGTWQTFVAVGNRYAANGKTAQAEASYTHAKNLAVVNPTQLETTL